MLLYSYNNLALLYQSQGRYTEAEPLYQKALAIAEQSLGVSHPNTITTRENLAACLREWSLSIQKRQNGEE